MNVVIVSGVAVSASAAERIGGIMAFITKKIASVFKENCVACGTCTKICPKQAISVYKGCFANVDTTLCVGCGKCVKICPTGCIEVKERDDI